MRVLVCGGRDFTDREKIRWTLEAQHYRYGFEVLIHGNARGADRMAGAWANASGVQEQRFNADWNRHGKAAGYIRNKQMLDEGRPGLVIAFPGGRGTADMVRQAKAAGVQVIEVPA